MSEWIFWSIAAIALLALGYLGYRGAMSQVRPLRIPEPAWRVALGCVRTRPKTLAFFVLLLSCGVGLQLFFTYFRGFNQVTLLLVALFWQAATATLTAVLAVRIHLFVIHVVLSQPLYWGGSGSARSSRREQSVRPFLGRAAAFGFMIWLLSTALRFGGNALLIALPERDRVISYYAVMVLTFLITTLFSLIRPAVSLGLARPLRTGILVAWRHSLALYLMTALLLAVPLLVGFLVRSFTPMIFAREDANAVTIVILTLFNTFQILAIEVSTVIFMKRAALLPGSTFDHLRACVNLISVGTQRLWRVT